MRKQKINGVVSKWLETLQGISHDESLKERGTRHGHSFYPQPPAPGYF